MNQPLVSVVIIFLNPGRFLSEAIQSVFDQTYKNRELLLVDDGSTDESSEASRQYANQNPNQIRYLEHEGHRNLGMSASRNLGIKNARGKYVALLDSDDVWLPSKLQEQVAIIESRPEASMVYGNHQFWKSWMDNSKQSDSLMDPGIPVDRVFLPPELMVWYYRAKKAALAIPSDLLFLRETAMAVGGFEDSYRNIHEDQIFLIKMFVNAPVFVSSKCWTRYRQHAESSVSVWQQQGGGGIQNLLDWSEKYLISQGVDDRQVWEALRKLRFRLKHLFWYRATERVKWKFQFLRNKGKKGTKLKK